MTKLVQFLKPVQKLAVLLFGHTLRDCSSGEPLGKFLIVVWRGKLHFIGTDNAHDKPFFPMFLSQKRTTYWVQTLGFRLHPTPDFPNERDRSLPPNSSTTRAGAPDD